MRKFWKKILAHMLAVTICFSAVEIPVYKLLKAGKTMEEALDSYYKTGYLKRYWKFTNYWSEATIKEKTYVYTKNKYMVFFSWPLLKHTFNTNQSMAARDAFAEFLLERRKCE